VPEYLAPGVYVEETSFRANSISGVGTSTTAFVGATLKGPFGGVPELMTSFGEFERIYGGLDDLNGKTNYIAHAVRVFFDNGGSRLYVSRVVSASAKAAQSDDLLASATDEARFVARFKGDGGNGEVLLYQKETPVSAGTIANAPLGSILRVKAADNTKKYYLKQTNLKAADDWKDSADAALTDAIVGTNPAPQLDLLTLTVVARDLSGNEISYEDLGFDAKHPRWVGSVLASNPNRRADALTNLFAIAVAPATVTALALRDGLFETFSQPRRIPLSGGVSGGDPSVDDYKAALKQLESLEDISIVASPGHSALAETLFLGVQQELLNFVSRRRAYPIAVLDTPPNQSLNEARTVRSRLDSSYAALYYPWVVVANPQARSGSAAPAELTLPPSGFLCGIYGRSDVERGVYKAPANEIVRGAIRFETAINFAQQEVLNPLGVNCLRFFPGRGYRVWGARTISSDSNWKYVNIRRYFNYLEASIDRSTQNLVFEPNGERLWTNVRDTISAFLYSEWVSGALLGGSYQEAYFVKCDRSTMTQQDLDEGRLICLIGVAAIKPAEFVIFRIGQKTADSRG